jgi:hypothetical protein
MLFGREGAWAEPTDVQPMILGLAMAQRAPTSVLAAVLATWWLLTLVHLAAWNSSFYARDCYTWEIVWMTGDGLLLALLVLCHRNMLG